MDKDNDAGRWHDTLLQNNGIRNTASTSTTWNMQYIKTNQQA